MWLTEKLNAGSGVSLRSGLVEESSQFAIQAESRYEQPEQLLPYGFSSVAQSGGQAVMLDGYCAGMANAPDGSLEAGEVRLYSAGGAEILLLNDGRVVINGQTFGGEEE